MIYPKDLGWLPGANVPRLMIPACFRADRGLIDSEPVTLPFSHRTLSEKHNLTNARKRI